MGLSKSWVGINWAAALMHLEGVHRVLVITVTSGLGVWEEQVQLHCPVPWRVNDHQGQMLSQSDDFVNSTHNLTFLVVNYQNLYSRAMTGQGREWLAVTNQTLHKFNAQAAIADESHHLGNPNAEQSKHACALVRPIAFRLFMTGTMFHRKPFFVFGQMKWYDNGATFGTAWTHFKKRIAIFKDPQGYVVKRYRNLSWMMRQVRPVVYIEKNIPKRPTIENIIPFSLTGENLRVYQTMEEHRVVRIKGEVLAADIVLTKQLWLMMMSGGFVKLPDSHRYVQIGHDKLAMCADRLREYMEQDIHKAVIACRFIPELAGVARVAKKVGFQVILLHGGIPPGKERHRRTKLFQTTDKPVVFISQISAGKESIELSAADTMLWYSLTDNAVEYDQFRKRIEVYGEKRTLMYDFLIASPRDRIAYESMKLKMDVARFLATKPQLVEQLTRTG